MIAEGPMGATIETLRWQFELAWKLAPYVLEPLDNAALDREIASPWPSPLAHTLAWANVELMKNLTEIGVVLREYRFKV